MAVPKPFQFWCAVPVYTAIPTKFKLAAPYYKNDKLESAIKMEKEKEEALPLS